MVDDIDLDPTEGDHRHRHNGATRTLTVPLAPHKEAPADDGQAEVEPQSGGGWDEVAEWAELVQRSTDEARRSSTSTLPDDKPKPAKSKSGKAKPAKSTKNSSSKHDAKAKAKAKVVEEPAVEEPEPSPAVATTGIPKQQHRRLAFLRPARVATGIVIIALAAAVVAGALQLQQRAAYASARGSALAAARSYAAELAGYNYADLNKDFGAVLANSTPSFKTSFTQSSNALKSTLTRFHATSTATVEAAGLVSSSPARSVVLVFLEQKVTNSEQKGTSTDRSQVEITLVKSGSRWLINQVTLL
ncbi:MAG: hypothetical protein ACRD0Z_17285 [Acidimicrobiales bacterium]